MLLYLYSVLIFTQLKDPKFILFLPLHDPYFIHSKINSFQLKQSLYFPSPIQYFTFNFLLSKITSILQNDSSSLLYHIPSTLRIPKKQSKNTTKRGMTVHSSPPAAANNQRNAQKKQTREVAQKSEIRKHVSRCVIAQTPASEFEEGTMK